jgi:hypothetical protein
LPINDQDVQTDQKKQKQEADRKVQAGISSRHQYYKSDYGNDLISPICAEHPHPFPTSHATE